LDEDVAGDDDSRCTIALQPPHRPEPRLEAPVVGLEAGLARHPSSVRYAVPVEIDADDLAPGQHRDAQGRTARTACNVQDTSRWSKIEPREKPIEFVKGQPTVLADVLTKRSAADVGRNAGCEVAVLGAVVIDYLSVSSHRCRV
jgi:hypothetical protein